MNAADFMHRWADENISPSVGMGDLDRLVDKCFADLKASGLDEDDVIAEVGTDVTDFVLGAIRAQDGA